MKIKLLNSISSQEWDSFCSHPVQSYAWGESRIKNGEKIERLGVYSADTLVGVLLLIDVPILKSSFRRGYIARSHLLSTEVCDALQEYGKGKYTCITIEPDIFVDEKIILPTQLVPTLFTRYTKWSPFIDLTLPYAEIEKKFSPTVRNQSRYAEKNGVTVVHGVTDQLFEDFFTVFDITRKRQHFVGHPKSYYRNVFDSLKENNSIRVFVAYKDSVPCAGACVLVFKNSAYYVYAGSLGNSAVRGTMNYFISSIIQWCQSSNLSVLDLFGSLAPHDTSNHPWQGYTQFKKSFGPVFKEYIGGYDIVIDKPVYTVLLFLFKVREKLTFMRKRL